ncbi:hypothetical protein F2Q69_00017240 [Brassica cretica]|uniref:Pectinesterase inhibitor domain-containing protein n=1 Tax=Brassica cretica TaxID=69181 RepID=A0A8S9R643_BRACR|nr:hypothetical protein F2Q69_00017240 [Brassica cretica]
MGFIGKNVLLTLLALCCFISFVFSTTALPPLKAPTKASILSPLKAPIKAPALSPLKAPTKAPALSPLKAPTKAPALSPTKAPIKLPTKAPIKPPILPPISPSKIIRTLAALRGMVYRKACKYAGVNNPEGAKPVKDIIYMNCSFSKIYYA